MNKVVARFAAAMLIVASITAILFFASNANANNGQAKVTICHRTASVRNPYVNITVAVSSVDGDSGNDRGQGDHLLEHTGQVWNSYMHQGDSWGDIIPPFDTDGNPKPGDSLNWNTEGQAIWNNKCNPATPPSLPTSTPKVVDTPTATPTVLIPTGTAATFTAVPSGTPTTKPGDPTNTNPAVTPCSACCNANIGIDPQDIQGFSFQTLYTFIIEEKTWQVMVLTGSAATNNLSLTDPCWCGPEIVVHPLPGQTLTVVVIGPDGIIHVSEITLK